MTSARHTFYIGSYTSANRPGIYAFTFDSLTGELTSQESFAGITNPSFLTIHPNKRWLYAVSELSQQQDGASGEVWAFRRIHETGNIEPINHQGSGGDSPCHLTIDATGRWLLTSNYSSGSVSVLPILTDGSLGEMTALIQHHGNGPNTKRQEGPHAHSTIFSPDQRFVIVADLGIDALKIYSFDPTVGRLHPHTHTPTLPGAGPRHMAFHPNSKYLFVANELDNTVAVYDYDATNGKLQARQTITTLPPDAPENTVADIHITSTGDLLYVSNRGHESIAIFQVETNGHLTPLAIRSSGGQFPRNFAIAPGNRFLLIANQHSDEVVVLPTQNAPEALGDPIARATIAGASCIQFV